MISSLHINISQEAMEFAYVKTEGDTGYIYRPSLSVTFSNGDKKFLVMNALVDTGSDVTILPLDIAHALNIELDDSKQMRLSCAGGGMFTALPSLKKITYTIEKKGFRPVSWKGTIYFAESEPVVLLGHYQCMENFDLTFYGPERKLSILPRFKQ